MGFPVGELGVRVSGGRLAKRQAQLAGGSACGRPWATA